MPILIVNATGNREGFEDQLCIDLKNRITQAVDTIEARGEQFFKKPILGDKPYQVIVIVAHGCRLDDSNTRINTNTRVNIGLGDPQDPYVERILNTPTIFMQILGKNPTQYVLVYCSCKALSIETLTSGIEDPNCIGVVASSDSIGRTDVILIANIVNSIYDSISQGRIEIEYLYSLVKNASQSYGEKPFIRFLDTPRVEVEE